MVKTLQATLQTGRLGEGAHVACLLDLPTSPAQTFLSSAKGDLEIFYVFGCKACERAEAYKGNQKQKVKDFEKVSLFVTVWRACTG